METALNISLLLVGSAGALLAFAGDTLNPEAVAWRHRITRVGWLSICFLFIALALGITKELLARQASKVEAARTKRAEAARMAAERQLGNVVSKLVATEKQLDAMRKDQLTQGDAGYVELQQEPVVAPKSYRTGEQLTLYGGDEFEYQMVCPGQAFSGPDVVSGLYLRVGTVQYPLALSSGRVRIAGPSGRPMRAEIINNGRGACGLKFLVTYTLRSRSRSFR